MTKWDVFFMFLILACMFIIVTHIHKDVTAIQVKLELLDDNGRIKPEYRR